MMNKSNRTFMIILALIVVLAVITLVTAYLHRQDQQNLQAYYEQELLVFRLDGQIAGIRSKEEIHALPWREFREVRRTSAGDAGEALYRGVELRDLLEQVNPDFLEQDQLILTAADGYTSILTISRVLEEDQVYLVYEQDGQPLPDRSSQGDGPYLILVRHEAFSQNWCKYVVEVRSG